MLRNLRPLGLVLLFLPSTLAFSGAAGRRSSTPTDLTFEQRVEAQEAIERGYYAHQIDAKLPFDEAVPRELLEKKVRTYLKETVALEKLWKVKVTAEMLRTETERIVAHTKMRDRLRDLFAALGDDPVLIQECLVRPVLVTRLIRDRFASDLVIHAAARREAEELRLKLDVEHVRLSESQPGRSVQEFARVGDPEAQAVQLEGGVQQLSDEAFDVERRKAPPSAGDVGPVVDAMDHFEMRALVSAEPDRLVVATYSVPKRSWEEWWRTHEGDLDELDARAVASEGPFVALLGATSAPSCPDDVWDNQSLGAPSVPSLCGPPQTMIWTGSLALVMNYAGSSFCGFRYDPVTDTESPISMTGAPPLRSAFTTLWSGSQLILWGGGAAPNFTSTGGLYDPQTDTWAPMDGGPLQPRAGHSAVWTGTRMIVYGGVGVYPAGTHPVTTLRDGASFDPATNTWSLYFFGAEGSPWGRSGHTAIWSGTEMIVWGGVCTAYPGMTPCPFGVSGTGFRYDPVSNAAVIIATSGSHSSTAGHTSLWTGSRMLVWGGSTPGGGSYNPAANSWSAVSTTNAPAGWSGSAAVWTGTSMIVWGGSNGSIDYDTGGRYDPVANVWAPTSMVGAPSPRSSHKSVWTGSLMVIYGGASGLDHGRYDPSTDTWLQSNAPTWPAARSGHSAVWTGSQMIIWGGNGNTGGRYDPALDDWSPMSALNAPSLRPAPTTVWIGARMLLWGGAGLNTGGLYDPVADVWSATSTAGAPAVRNFHASAWTGSELIIWGGTSSTSCTVSGPFFSDGARYNPSTDLWSPLGSTGAPSARCGASGVWTGTRFIVWGGRNGSGNLDTGYSFDPTTDQWSPISTTQAPSFRARHTAVWTGTEMLIWAGDTSNGSGLYFGTTTGGLYNPATNTWRPVSTVNARREAPPGGMTRAANVWTGRELFIWAGEAATGAIVNTGSRYNPSTDSWRSMSVAGAPPARVNATAVWTGGSAIVWGGDLGTTRFRDGGIYFADPAGDQDGDGFLACSGDCDEAHVTVYPGGRQICDGLNNDCTDPVYPSLGTTESDLDGDGFEFCQGDCDDTRNDIYPGAPELCDGVLNNCTGPVQREVDDDDDGSLSCEDCNDGNANVYPGAPEICDGWDDDCNGSTPTNESDSDGDGVRRCQNDCDDSNSQLWGTPGEVLSPAFSSPTELSWAAPASPGSTNWVYDVIRSGSSSNFGAGAACQNSNTTSTTSNIDTIPALGSAIYLLIRAENNCPGQTGQGSLGTYSNGTPRTARSCN